MSSNDKLKLFDDIFDLQHNLQMESSFKNSKEPAMHLIYHLFLKARRSLKTMKIILDSQELENSYIETLPLLRIQLETYFHLLYIVNHEDKTICIEEYDVLQKKQLNRVARNLKTLKHDQPEMVNDQERQFIDDFGSYRSSTEIEHLEQLWQLAKAVGKYAEYAKIYSLLSSFVHYNPSTRVAYSDQEDDRTIYNRFTHNEAVKDTILKYSIGIALNTIGCIAGFLEIREIEEQQLEILKEWSSLFGRQITFK